MFDSQAVTMDAGVRTVPRRVETVSRGTRVTPRVARAREGVYQGGCHPHVNHVSV